MSNEKRLKRRVALTLGFFLPNAYQKDEEWELLLQRHSMKSA